MRQHELGGVSIFIVIFCALLITIVTISFVSIMIRSQQQASNADLSNSAYDSALAGVEDAKRLLLLHRDCLQSNVGRVDECADISTAISDRKCSTNKVGLYKQDGTDPEVQIQRQEGTDTSSGSLNQSYTCVVIDYEAEDLKGTLSEGVSQLVPIETSDGASFDQMKISWFLKPDGSSAPLDLPDTTPVTLPGRASWSTAQPPILRTQLIQTAATFSSAYFDQDNVDKSNTNTLFLYPHRISGNRVAYPYTADDRTGSNSPKGPQLVKCEPDVYLNENGYACHVTLDLPEAIGGARENLFVQLSALYNKTDYKIELFNSATPEVPVDIVGPVVDSTGRANDLFRRVKARINFATAYPQADIDIKADLCKNFSVTDTPDGYSSECGS